MAYRLKCELKLQSFRTQEKIDRRLSQKAIFIIGSKPEVLKSSSLHVIKITNLRALNYAIKAMSGKMAEQEPLKHLFHKSNKKIVRTNSYNCRKQSKVCNNLGKISQEEQRDLCKNNEFCSALICPTSIPTLIPVVNLESLWFEIKRKRTKNKPATGSAVEGGEQRQQPLEVLFPDNSHHLTQQRAES